MAGTMRKATFPMSNVPHPSDSPVRVVSQIGPWAMVPVWVLSHLQGSHLAVYVALRSYADHSRDARPFVASLAARAGVTTRTVERALARMRERGLISTDRWYRPDGSIGGLEYHLADVEPSAATVPADPPPPPDDARPAVTSPAAAPTEPRRPVDTGTGSGDVVEALAVSLTASVGDLARNLHPGTLTAECARLAREGWTPTALGHLARERGFSGARSGALVTWLRSLGTHRPTPPVRSGPCPLHPAHRASRCPQCERTAFVPTPGYLRSLIAS